MRFFGIIGEFFDRYIAEIVEVVGVVLAALSAYFLEYKEVNNCIFCGFDVHCEAVARHLLYVGIGLIVISFIIKLFDKERIRKSLATFDKLKNDYSSLQDEYADLYNDYKLLYDRFLADISNKLGFTSTERISIYKFENNKFFIMSRYSSNAEYNDRRRTEYPSNEGFIGEAWGNQNGEIFVTLQSDPTDIDSYIAEITGLCKMRATVIRKMKMKSKQFYVKKINNADNTYPIAIMVFESTNVNKVVKNNIDQVLIDENNKLVSLIQRHRKSQKTSLKDQGI